MRLFSNFPKRGILSLIYLISLFFFAIIFDASSQNFPVSDFDPYKQQTIAFPGAEGFGKFATGGRGGRVIKVTNLNDDGLGSLRAAIESTGPRIIVFEVSGNIKLKSFLTIRDGNITIAGQTAPGEGITIQNYPLRIMNVENVIIRFIRSRMGDLSTVQGDALDSRGVKKMIIDHCSFSWGTDETCSVYDVTDATIQNCIISEGLNNSVHSQGMHGFGSLMSGEGLSLFKNLWSHFTIRNPRFTPSGSQGIVDFRNNVIYNWEFRPAEGSGDVNVNLFYNYFKPGPATIKRGGSATLYFLRPNHSEENISQYGKYFLEGNKLQGHSIIELDQWTGVRLENATDTDLYLETLKNKDQNGKLVPFTIPDGLYNYNRNADQAYQSVLDFVGSSLFRDEVDTRIIKEVFQGTSTYKGSKTGLLGIIDSQKDVGGWPTLKSLAAPKDTDGDGMPDSWEVDNGLNPNTSNESEYNLSPYYTDIEVYINSLVQNLIAQQNPGVPKQVKLVLPTNNTTVSPVDISFAWEPVLNGDLFRLQISKSSDFSSNVITIDNIKNFSVIRPSLDSNSTYFWRVRASNSSGNGPYSLTRTFKTGSLNVAPGSTLLLQPGNASTQVALAPLLTWAKVPNAKTYQIQISTSSSFSSIAVNQSNISTASFQSTKLAENQVYYWRVRVSNDFGTGAYSQVGSFRTVNLNSPPEAVVSIRPNNGVKVNPVNVKLEWVPNTTAERYIVQVSSSIDFSNLIISEWDVRESHLEIPNLNANTNYYWRVRGANRSGNGFYSSVNYFSTTSFTNTPNQIQLISPENDINIFSTSITFGWSPDPVAKSYRLQLSTSPTFNSFVSNVGGLTGTTRTLSNLSPNTLYYWRVIASNETGDSPISEIRKVRSTTYSGTPPAAKLISPSNLAVIGASEIVFNWENQPNSENYRLEVSEQLNFSSLVFSRNSISSTSFTVTTLSPNKTYYWRIRTSNPAGTGETSAPWVFSTVSQNINLTQPVLVSPNTTSQISSSSVLLTWQTVTDASGYEVQVSENMNFSSISFGQSSLTGTSFTAQPLKSNVAYYWRVRAKSNAINSAWSEIRSFTTGTGNNNPLLNSGLVGYWTMEEGSGNRMMDQSGKGNHATIQDANGVTWKEGKVGKAISLNGNNGKFGQVAHNTSLTIPKAITLSAWVKPSILGRNTIISKSESNSNGFELWLDLDGKIEFRLNRGKNGSAYRLVSDFNYSNHLGKWFHIVATFDGSNSKIYINGIEDIARTYAPFGIGTSSGILVIGALGTIQRFRGEIDELRLYERAFSDIEIPLLLGEEASPIPPTQTPSESLVGYWKMDEGSGNQMIDHSGNGNNASIQNTSGVTWTEGILGKSISLNGNSGVFGLAPHKTSLALPNTLTIAAWVRPNEIGRKTIVSKANGNGFELWFDHNGQIEFRLNRGKDGTAYRLLSNYNYSNALGQWIHIAATFDGSISRIFVNGSEDTSAVYAPFSIGTNSGDLVIGALGTIQRWRGGLDELRLYDKALSVQDIQALMGAKPSLNSSALSEDLVGHWKMDEGSGNRMLDHSGIGNNATIQNTNGVSWTNGVIGQAIRLDGNSGVFGSAPHHTSLSIPQSLTIAVWINPELVARNSIISKADGNGFELWLDNNGQIEFRLNRGNNGSSYRLLSNFNYSNQIGKWIHVTATFDGSTSKIYINGQDDVSRSFTPFSIGTNSGDLVIGALGAIQRFRGRMDDLRLYSRSLTSSEVQQLASNNQTMRIGQEFSKKTSTIQQENLLSSEKTNNQVSEEEKTTPILFPNPAESTIQVKSLWQKEGKIKSQVYDMKGVLLMERELDIDAFRIEMDLSPLRLTPGNYMLILQDAQHREILRFIKK